MIPILDISFQSGFRQYRLSIIGSDSMQEQLVSFSPVSTHRLFDIGHDVMHPSCPIFDIRHNVIHSVTSPL